MKKFVTCVMFSFLTFGFFNLPSAYAEEYVAPKSYSEMINSGEIDPTQITESQWNEFLAKDKADFENYNNASVPVPTDGGMTEESFQIKSCDILVTDRSGSLGAGLTGHAAIYVGDGHVIEAKGPKYLSNMYNFSDFKATNTYSYHTIKVYRSNRDGWGAKAATYAKYHMRNIKYFIDLNAWTKNSTYCSKLIWQSYYYGVGPSATKYDQQYQLITPYGVHSDIVGVGYDPVHVYK